MTITATLADQANPQPNPPNSSVTVTSHPTNTSLVIVQIGDQTRTVLAAELQNAAQRAKKS